MSAVKNTIIYYLALCFNKTTVSVTGILIGITHCFIYESKKKSFLVLFSFIAATLPISRRKDLI